MAIVKENNLVKYLDLNLVIVKETKKDYNLDLMMDYMKVTVKGKYLH